MKWCSLGNEVVNKPVAPCCAYCLCTTCYSTNFWHVIYCTGYSMQCLYLSSMAWHMLCGLPDTGSESFKSCNICHGKRVTVFSSSKSPKARGLARTGHPGQLSWRRVNGPAGVICTVTAAWKGGGGTYCLPWQGLPSFGLLGYLSCLEPMQSTVCHH